MALVHECWGATQGSVRVILPLSHIPSWEYITLNMPSTKALPRGTSQSLLLPSQGAQHMEPQFTATASTVRKYWDAREGLKSTDLKKIECIPILDHH